METPLQEAGGRKSQDGFSLPMRDGNVSGTAREVREEQGFSLPMRDGNSPEDLGRDCIALVLAYL